MKYYDENGKRILEATIINSVNDINKKQKQRSYSEILVDLVKVVGQDLIDNADEIVSKVNHISDFKIEISFDQEAGSHPEITLTQSYFPDWSKYEKIIFD